MNVMATIPGAYATSPLNPAVSDEDLSGALRSRMMRRMLVRLTPLVLLLLVAPLAAEAQQARIGFLALGSPEGPGHGAAPRAATIDFLLQELHGRGYVERQNVVIEFGGAAGKFDPQTREASRSRCRAA